MAQRVVFSFDPESLETLRGLQRDMNSPSMGSVVRDAIQLSEVLRDQVADGFTEVILRNPKTNEQKTLVIPSLRKVAKRMPKGI